MKLKKLLLLPVGLMLSIGGCVSKPFSTYYMATTSFKYDPTYTSFMVKLNGVEIGGGFGGGMNTSPVKTGPQVITWEESNSDKFHQAKNTVTLTKNDLKGMKYLAVHLYPDDTVEITTSNSWPSPLEQGLEWQQQLKNSK